MSIFKLLHIQSQAQSIIKIKSFSSSLTQFSRTLCSSNPDKPSQPTDKPEQSQESERIIPKTQQIVQPVSYAVKPKDPSVDSAPQESQNSVNNAARFGAGPGPVSYEDQNMSREDIRYVKDMPTISPVAYAVAPLPDDRPREEVGGDELGRERGRIENERRMQQQMRRILRGGRGEDDDVKVPFPTLIKVDSESKKKKVSYDLKDAIQLVKSNAKRNFDETLEAHVRLATDLRRTDLKLSGSVMLPHGTTKNVKVAVFAEGAAADDARDGGADIVGGLDLIEGIKSGTVKVNFDICYATVDIMRHVKQLGRQLTRLMPKKEHGTITQEVGRAIRELKGSGVLFRKDKTAIVHVGLGKVSLEEDALRENVAAFTNALLLAKPPGLKKSSKYAGYVESFHICSTMGPSFPVTIQSLSMAVDRFTRLQRV